METDVVTDLLSFSSSFETANENAAFCLTYIAVIVYSIPFDFELVKSQIKFKKKNVLGQFVLFKINLYVPK